MVGVAGAAVPQGIDREYGVGAPSRCAHRLQLVCVTHLSRSPDHELICCCTCYPLAMMQANEWMKTNPHLNTLFVCVPLSACTPAGCLKVAECVLF